MVVFFGVLDIFLLGGKVSICCFVCFCLFFLCFVYCVCLLFCFDDFVGM